MKIIPKCLVKNHLDVPIAVLEEYGLSYSCLNQLEDCFGVIWLRDLVGLTEDDLRKGWFGDYRIKMIRRTIRKLVKNREFSQSK